MNNERPLLGLKGFQEMVNEAKHSFKVLLAFVGDIDTICNRLLLKWPDVIDSFIEGNDNKVKADLSILMCTPLLWIIQSVTERPTIGKECDDIMFNAHHDPILAKRKLVILYNDVLDEAGMSEHKIGDNHDRNTG